MRHLNQDNGIVYKPLEDRDRGTIQGYSYTKNWTEDLSKGGTGYDLRGLKRDQIKRAMYINSNQVEAKYRIGFEVEKNAFAFGSQDQTTRGSEIGRYAIFRGVETDSSCGVEAITHILPLVPNGIWRTKVFNMMHQAKELIEDDSSPSDASCGGHITLSVMGMSGQSLIKEVRKYSGVIQSLYRVRLYKTTHQSRTLRELGYTGGDYCNGNITMRSNRYTREWTNASRHVHSQTNNGGQSSKFTFCKHGSDFIEFRVPPRVTSVKCLMLRYQLFYELIDFAVKHKDASYINSLPQLQKKFLKIVKPLIIKISDGDTDKAKAILTDAKHFQAHIDSDGEIVKPVVKAFIRPSKIKDFDRKKRWFRGVWK